MANRSSALVSTSRSCVRFLDARSRSSFRASTTKCRIRGPGSSRLGKPLRSILHGGTDIPIYTATISPKGVEVAAEVADGFIPVWTTPKGLDTFVPHLEAGFRKAGAGKGFNNFEIAVSVNIVVNNDLKAARESLKAGIALYVGGMGARDKNFYTDHVSRQGWADDAHKIQDLFLSGKRQEAVAAFPMRWSTNFHWSAPRSASASAPQHGRRARQRCCSSAAIRTRSRWQQKLFCRTLSARLVGRCLPSCLGVRQGPPADAAELFGAAGCSQTARTSNGRRSQAPRSQPNANRYVISALLRSRASRPIQAQSLKFGIVVERIPSQNFDFDASTSALASTAAPFHRLAIRTPSRIDLIRGFALLEALES
jgi:hypothetical protein